MPFTSPPLIKGIITFSVNQSLYQSPYANDDGLYNSMSR